MSFYPFTPKLGILIIYVSIALFHTPKYSLCGVWFLHIGQTPDHDNSYEKGNLWESDFVYVCFLIHPCISILGKIDSGFSRVFTGFQVSPKPRNLLDLMERNKNNWSRRRLGSKTNTIPPALEVGDHHQVRTVLSI